MSALHPCATESEPLGPGSISWQLVGDWRLFTVLGRGLLLQVGHPVVAAGVTQHSSYKQNPYARLQRSLRAILGVVYGGPKAATIAAALRARHASIRGVDGHGESYSALDPEPFQWVHATIFESIHTMCERFVRPLSPAESEQLYQEFRHVARCTDCPRRSCRQTYPRSGRITTACFAIVSRTTTRCATCSSS